MVTINIQKKDLYLIGAIVVFLIGAGVVIATGGTPNIHGHNLGEIALPSCTNGQVLKYNNGWSCGTDNTGGGGIEPIITQFVVVVNGVIIRNDGTNLGYHDLCAVQIVDIVYSSVTGGGCGVWGAQNSNWVVGLNMGKVNHCVVICYDWVA